MRFLVYLLLLANVAMAAWVSLQPPQSPPEYQPVPVPPGIEPVVLLSERKPEPKDEPVALDTPGTETDAGPDDVVNADEQSPEEAPAETTLAVADTPGESAAAPAAEPQAEAPEPSEPPERVCHTVGPLLKPDSSCPQRPSKVSHSKREPGAGWVGTETGRGTTSRSGSDELSQPTPEPLRPFSM